MKKLLTRSLKLSPLCLLTYAYCANNPSDQDQQASGLNNFKGFKNRQQHLTDVVNNNNYDIVVIGGGATGAGVCLDASTRGLRTLVIEKNDFGSGTSSKSTKLIHGGVRYLQQVFALSWDSLSNRIQKFKLVTQAIKQRGVLLRNAAYMNQKIPFVIPTQNSFWSAYYYVGSIFYYMIYWFASQKNTVKFNFPFFFNRSQLHQIFPYISDKYQSGVVYQDGCFNDSRLLLTTLLTSTLSRDQYQYLPNGHAPANILNKAQFVDFVKDGNGQVCGVVFADSKTGKKYTVNSKYVVNCTGTWADKIRKIDNPECRNRICIVAGSHLTYDNRVSSNKFGLCLPSPDGRILLVVPWLNRVIAGTTQKNYDEPVTNPVISLEQRSFLQTQMTNLMDKLPPVDLITFEKSRWTGLRPLVQAENAQSTKDIARTHVVQRSQSGLYSLMGGKWTTYRKMGQDLIDEISKEQQKKVGKGFAKSISQHVLLVGSCLPSLRKKLIKDHGELGEYLYKTYGSLSQQILKGDLTTVHGLITKSQLNYIANNQMVNDVQDILLRRLRIAFLNDKHQTLSLVPLVSRILYQQQQRQKQLYQKQQQKQQKKQKQQKQKLQQKSNDSKILMKQAEDYIRKNIQTICSYQFD